MRAKFVDKYKRTDDISTYQFAVDSRPKYLAGQYIELVVPHNGADDRGQKRWFTLSSSPSNSYLEITTRYTAGSSSSFKKALSKLKQGDTVTISEPMGDFVLPIDKSIPLLFVAGGIGITPYLSILGYLADKKEERDIRLLYAVKSKDDALNLDGLLSSTISLEIITKHNANQELTAEYIKEEADKLREPLVYIAGPEGMVESLNKQLSILGIASDRLVGDYFPGYD
jgi:ferredoxin-NADP reductase